MRAASVAIYPAGFTGRRRACRPRWLAAPRALHGMNDKGEQDEPRQTSPPETPPALIVAALLAGPAFADKPDGAGGGKPDRQGGNPITAVPRTRRQAPRQTSEQGNQDGTCGDETRGRGGDRDGDRRVRPPAGPRPRTSHRPRRLVAARFGLLLRPSPRVVRQYYGDRFPCRRLPARTGKEGQRRTPPGQAKKWRIGAPLPRDVGGTTPGRHRATPRHAARGHRFVRVAPPTSC